MKGTLFLCLLRNIKKGTERISETGGISLWAVTQLKGIFKGKINDQYSACKAFVYKAYAQHNGQGSPKLPL